MSRVCLLEVIKQQEEIIAEQSEMIARLANENAEQEGIIGELMRSCLGDLPSSAEDSKWDNRL